MKIAYIEDNKDALSIFRRKLNAEGFDCDTFNCAEQALPKIYPGSYDLLLIDIRLPNLSGIQLLGKIRQQNINIPAILITAFNSLEYAKEAFKAGANYLLEKPFTYKNLRQVIGKVGFKQGTLQHYIDRGLEKIALTSRELEVGRCILKGLSNMEIARNLSISEKTVKQHVTQIFEKADVSSRSELFSYIFPA